MKQLFEINIFTSDNNPKNSKSYFSVDTFQKFCTLEEAKKLAQKTCENCGEAYMVTLQRIEKIDVDF